MCLITVKARGIPLPTDYHLRNGESANPDGIGIAWWKDGKTEINIKKNFLNIEEFLAWFHQNIKQEDACIVHFRLATAGLKDVGNRHPFPITKNWKLLREPEIVCQTAVAHNGVLPEYSGTTYQKFSDTQKFVVDILADDAVKNNLGSEAVQKLISNFIGKDRLAILCCNGDIWLFGEYYKEDNILFSSYSFNYRSYDTGFNNNNWWNKKKKTEDIEKIEDKTKEDDPNDEEDDDKNDEYLDADNGETGECEGCKQKKFIRYFEYGDISGFFCKSCRKGIRKGKINKQMINNRENFGAKFDNGNGEVQCPSCLEWVPKRDITVYNQEELCPKCLQDLLSTD